MTSLFFAATNLRVAGASTQGGVKASCRRFEPRGLYDQIGDISKLFSSGLSGISQTKCLSFCQTQRSPARYERIWCDNVSRSTWKDGLEWKSVSAVNQILPNYPNPSFDVLRQLWSMMNLFQTGHKWRPASLDNSCPSGQPQTMNHLVSHDH